MILLDVNILLYAHSESSPRHRQAREWIEKVMAEREEIGLPWSTIHGFLRVVTNPAAYTRPRDLASACQVIDDYLVHSNVSTIEPAPDYWKLFRRVLTESQAGHRLLPDAHLASLALQHNAAICTNDKDFTRFRGVRVINPVAQQ
jgi:uncharacterized protein